jgi:cysteinyl-tRNA synthetase
MLRTHYRQPIDWTVKALEEAEKTIDDWNRMAVPMTTAGARPSQVAPRPLHPLVEDALCDDLNTPLALAEMHKLRNLAGHQPGLIVDFSDALRFFGFLRDEVAAALELTVEQKDLVEARWRARKDRNWAESDRIRDKLAALGVTLKDNKDGTTSWERKR